MNQNDTCELTDCLSFFTKNGENTPTSDYYVNYFFNDARNGKITRWNVCAFLFGPYWFILRKMYVCAILYFALYVFLITYGTFFMITDSFFTTFTQYTVVAVLSLMAGLWGNYLYFLKFKSITSNAPAEMDKRVIYLNGKGGISMISVSVPVVAVIALFYIGI